MGSDYDVGRGEGGSDTVKFAILGKAREIMIIFRYLWKIGY